VSFAAITLCIASQQVFIVVVYFVIDSVRKLLDTSSYVPEESLRMGEMVQKREGLVLLMMMMMMMRVLGYHRL
jgi:hypothetical protein